MGIGDINSVDVISVDNGSFLAGLHTSCVSILRDRIRTRSQQIIQVNLSNFLQDLLSPKDFGWVKIQFHRVAQVEYSDRILKKKSISSFLLPNGVS